MSEASYSGSEQPMATGDTQSDQEDARDVEGAGCGGSRKRPAGELMQGGCSRQRGLPGRGGDHEQMPAFHDLTGEQRTIIRRVINLLDTEQDSVVITNPLKPQGPIVYVTNAWQDMCGYNMQQAVGQNPRLTQGEGTDPDTVKTMKLALTAEQPCRVRIINYRGYNREPFWNCLSVQPVFLNRKLVLFAARLQDYSHHLSRLVSLTPSQFCKTGDLFQMRVRLADLKSSKSFAHPRFIDVTPDELGETEEGKEASAEGGGASSAAVATDAAAVGAAAGASPSASASGAAGFPALPARHVKRLGFGGLELEPEYLLDRLRHECAELDLPCIANEVRVQGAEVLRMEVSSIGPAASSASVASASTSSITPATMAAGAEGAAGSSSGGGASGSAAASSSSIPPPLPLSSSAGAGGRGGGLRALLHVMPEGEDGTYAISLMRLVGDTFEFHSLYRSLRDRLTDITVVPGGGGGGSLRPSGEGAAISSGAA